MRLTFTHSDIKEISEQAYYTFIGEFRIGSDPDDSESEEFDLDLDDFGCGEITSEVEKVVQTTWEACDPLEGVYGPTISDLIKETVKTVDEETQCAGLKFFNHITPSEDQSLIRTCTAVAYWCCCENLKKVSPIIAEASASLMH